MRFLITAIGSMSANAVITSLRDNFAKCEIIGTNIYPGEWLYQTSIIDAFYKVPKAKDSSYLQSIVNIVTSRSIDVIIPLTDPEVDVLSENRKMIESFSTILSLCGNDTIRICRDKGLLYKHFANNCKVRAIKSYSVFEAAQVEWSYPVVAKPKNGRSSEGLKYITSKKELLLLDESYVVQEFMDGEIITVDFIRDYWGNIVCIPRKELIRTANGAGLTVEIFQDKIIEETISEIAIELNIYGCMNVEFIHDHNFYYLMDINPRFSAGIGFSKLAGYDFIKNHINVFKHNKIDPVSRVLNGIAIRCEKEYMLVK